MSECNFSLTDFIRAQHNHCSACDGSRVLYVGSTAELPHVMQTYNPTDIDLNNISYHHIAIPKCKPGCRTSENLQKHSEGCHSGYTHLLGENGQLIQFKIRTIHDIKGQRGNLSFQTTMRDFLRTQTNSRNNYFNTPLDLVEPIYCPYWPDEASEWLTRSRKHNWPSKETVTSIKKIGCTFVWVNNNDSKKMTVDSSAELFRISFSVAEVILLRSWTRSQIYVYHLLRLIKQDIVNKLGCNDFNKKAALCTYYLKTLMLWACEEMPFEMCWPGDGNITMLEQCLLSC
jgi:Mab-21 protein